MLRNTLKISIFKLAVLALFWASGAHAAVKGEVVTYTIAGEEYTGYLARDTAVSGKQPGIIVVHEWWGHDEYARKRADMLAARGYTALALDMYGTGKLAAHPKDAGSFAKEALASADRAQARFRAAYRLLKKHKNVDAGKTAAIGYCFGGKVVLNMARAGMDLKGVVSFHGNLTPLPGLKASPGKVKARVRAFSGGDDPFVKPVTIKAIKAEMKAAGVDYKFVSYPDTVHSFTSPAATARGKKLGLPLAYNAKADGDSWRRTMDFFDEIFR